MSSESRSPDSNFPWLGNGMCNLPPPSWMGPTLARAKEEENKMMAQRQELVSLSAGTPQSAGNSHYDLGLYS
ncbi:hypothetical protein KIN20_024849 [Parelaphostrongylus tenuis]|uniref:Uncharacterized protein n=1 Tax=Parelaphostrongylus tenuis TaxID=148309 RepID=A0AAD5QWJ4_PARTN|nr:hypothetical protein KIN20_024849 [Parelaphostrongylus tenuis]